MFPGPELGMARSIKTNYYDFISALSFMGTEWVEFWAEPGAV